MPGLSQAEGTHAGQQPPRAGFLAVDAPNVLVTVLKPAEDGQGLIVRAQETAGQPARTTLKMVLIGREFPIELGPWQVKTWRVGEDGAIRDTNFLEA
jgi:alpha-mannosidase